jgi:hypothetical protein
MTQVQPRLDERTKYEAEMEVKFGCRFNEMNARFHRHLDFIFGFVGLFGGSGALIAALGQYKILGIITGAIVAAVAVIERLAHPVEYAIAHDTLKEKYTDLLVRVPDMPLAEIEKELKTLQAKNPCGVTALSVPAYNATVRSNGRTDYVMEETYWQKTVALLA